MLICNYFLFYIFLSNICFLLNICTFLISAILSDICTFFNDLHSFQLSVLFQISALLSNICILFNYLCFFRYLHFFQISALFSNICILFNDLCFFQISALLCNYPCLSAQKNCRISKSSGSRYTIFKFSALYASIFLKSPDSIRYMLPHKPQISSV